MAIHNVIDFIFVSFGPVFGLLGSLKLSPVCPHPTYIVLMLSIFASVNFNFQLKPYAGPIY